MPGNSEESNNIESEPTTVAPPIGVIPRNLHEERRMKELDSAIMRYISAHMLIPLEWLEERNELLERWRP